MEGDRGGAREVGVAGVVGDRCGSCMESSESEWEEAGPVEPPLGIWRCWGR